MGSTVVASFILSQIFNLNSALQFHSQLIILSMKCQKIGKHALCHFPEPKVTSSNSIFYLINSTSPKLYSLLSCITEKNASNSFSH